MGWCSAGRGDAGSAPGAGAVGVTNASSRHCKRHPESLQLPGLLLSSSVPTLFSFKVFYLCSLANNLLFVGYTRELFRCNFSCAFFANYCVRETPEGEEILSLVC